MWATISDLLARYSDVRVANAASADVPIVTAIRAGQAPPDPVKAEEVAAVRGQLEAALADAQAEAESAVAARYALPLAAAPRLLVRLVVDRAMFHLYGDVVPKELRSRRQGSQALLKAIRAGERLLVAPDGTPLRPRPRVRTAAADPVLTGPALEAYR